MIMDATLTGDDRVDQLLATITRCVHADAGVQQPASTTSDKLDIAIQGLDQLVKELVACRAAAANLEQRFDQVLDVVGSMAALDFTKQVPMGEEDTNFDALAAGINMLGEELTASMVSRTYVHNILESMNDALVVIDAQGMIQTVNRATTELLGYQKEELLDQPIGIMFADMDTALTGGRAMPAQVIQNTEVAFKTRNGRELPVSFSASVMSDAFGEHAGMVCVAHDITERKQAEEALRHSIVQEEVIRAQSAALAELSTPIIPITDQVMVMPLIGTIDSQRAQQVLEVLLHEIAGRGAAVVIIDITGVVVVDTQVANALLQAAQAVKLLGARVMLTGIRPEVAQTLVGLGADLRSVVTYSTLQSGLAVALRRTNGAQ